MSIFLERAVMKLERRVERLEAAQAKEKPAPKLGTGSRDCTLCFGSGYWVHPHSGLPNTCRCVINPSQAAPASASSP